MKFTPFILGLACLFVPSIVCPALNAANVDTIVWLICWICFTVLSIVGVICGAKQIQQNRKSGESNPLTVIGMILCFACMCMSASGIAYCVYDLCRPHNTILEPADY